VCCDANGDRSVALQADLDAADENGANDAVQAVAAIAALPYLPPLPSKLKRCGSVGGGSRPR
jgi:hypothetical protein